MPVIRRMALAAALFVCLVADQTAAGRQSVVGFLDRYAAAKFDEVVEELSGDLDFADLLEQLRRDGPSWIDAQGSAGRERRRLVAATFALEAARADEWHEWKWVVRQPAMTVIIPPDGGRVVAAGRYVPLNVLMWKPPPLLIEWGCELLRKDATPRPIERWWQLAALAVAQRSEDPAFLVGDPAIGKDVGGGEIINRQDEIKHLDHVMKRFPDEHRFALAQGIARDRIWPDDALRAYESLAKDPDVGGEATMRLGAMQLRQGRLADAIRQLDRAETLTRDPYVIYLSRFFKAQALDRQRRPDQAQAAYRGAVAAMPNAQSATIPLAASLLLEGRRAEAHALIGDMLAADPQPADPWREYVHADDRFWRYLIGKLRVEIQK